MTNVDERHQQLERVAAEIRRCRLCALHHTRTNAVPGAGPVDADIFFLGEAPGAREDEQGLPFVGASGRFLNQLLESIELSSQPQVGRACPEGSRDLPAGPAQVEPSLPPESRDVRECLGRDRVFISNVVKCRPPDNRTPHVDEVSACAAYLDRQLELIQPRLIVTLGRFAMERFFPGERISEIHGRPSCIDNVVILPLYHPAAALYRGSLRSVIEDDFKRIAQLLERTDVPCVR